MDGMAEFDLKFMQEEELRRRAHDRTREIFERQEEILAAFIAKYGVGPDEVEMVESPFYAGTRTWCVRLKPPRVYGGFGIAFPREAK